MKMGAHIHQYLKSSFFDKTKATPPKFLRTNVNAGFKMFISFKISGLV